MTEFFETKIKIGDKMHIIRLLQGDITDQESDAIVNAANSNLILGAGVAGAIRHKGGPKIQEECNKIGGTQVGTAVITSGGNLKTKFVIHAVGPIWNEYTPIESQKLLSNAVMNSLKTLEEHGLQSITFPAISTGIFGFPKDLAANVMMDAILLYLQSAFQPLIIQIILFSNEDFKIFYNSARNKLK